MLEDGNDDDGGGLLVRHMPIDSRSLIHAFAHTCSPVANHTLGNDSSVKEEGQEEQEEASGFR